MFKKLVQLLSGRDNEKPRNFSSLAPPAEPSRSKPVKPLETSQGEQHWFEEPLAGDHLGPAAIAGNAAKKAIKEKMFDDAWRHLHEQQEHHLAYSAKYGFTAQQTMALAGGVHKSMANIMRLEGRHDQAMIHMMYYMATANRPPKADQQKLGAYFRRCEFKQIDEAKLQRVMSALKRDPVFDAARGIVAQWRADEG